MAIDRADVAGVEKSLVIENMAVVLEIGSGHCRTAYLEPSECFAIPRQAAVRVVGDFHFDTERRVALLL